MTDRPASRSVTREAFAAGRFSRGERRVPEEVPVAFSFLGTTHAVMMASPSDLEDFARGFCLSEGLVQHIAEIEHLEAVTVDGGIDMQMRLVPGAQARLKSRQRAVAGPVGCGLCGVESIDEALRDVPEVAGTLALSPSDIAEALKALARRQTLNHETRAVHAAGFFLPGTGIVGVREDVGRHNALDKLIGALARDGVAGETGAVILTSRVSLEMVQKTARLGSPVIVAVSAPTSLAIDVADRAGITLVAVARGAEFEVFCHPERIQSGRSTHVA